ncbi:MAG: hypothetical protein P8R54_21200 [Myxococcota bacterium]|nr:hypothetical protein [Myxococcota bacterium]
MFPSEWYSGLDVELSIEGEDLFPAVQVAGGEVDIDREYRAWLESPLGSIELEGVSLRSYTELSGWVRAGLLPGRYDLHVRTPTGADVVLPGAFRATDTAIRAIGIDNLNSYSHSVGENIALNLFLEGWDGEPVHQSLEIDIVAERDDGEPVDITFHKVTLNDQRILADEDGIRGMLDEDGEALVLFNITNPGSVELEIRPVLEESSIDEARVDLFFEAGAVEFLDVSLSSDSRSFNAGDVLSVEFSFLDELENPTQLDEALTVHLQEVCSDEIDNDKYFSLVNTRTVSFEIHGATSEDCPENKLIARIVSDSGTLEGASDSFLVSAGAPASFDIDTFITDVTAGEQTVPLLISIHDQFDNLITTYDQPLAFNSSDGTALAANCSGFVDGLALCDVELYKAGEEQISITSSDGVLAGLSEVILVQPAEASVAIVSTDKAFSTADDGRDFSLRVTDAYSNDILVPSEGTEGAPVFSIGGTPVSCSPDGTDTTGVLYHCVLTQAAVDRQLTVNVLGLSTISTKFEVVNGGLASVLLSGPGNVRAGQIASVTLAGFDAYENPFIEVGAGSVDVELLDDSGDISAIATLGSDGTALFSSLVFTTAWEGNHLEANQAGQWLGSSMSFTVSAADMHHFLVEPERVWGWVNEALVVRLTAADAYDNTISAYSGSATLSSASGLGASVSASTWSGGVAEVEFVPSSAGFTDTLSATDGTFTGASSRFDALSSDCIAPPIAALTIDGSSTGVACRTSGITSAITLSALGSEPTIGVLSSWYFYTDTDGWQHSSTEDITKTWTSEGVFDVSVVVATDEACAAQTSTVLYVADDDGEPAGPVTLSSVSAVLQADTSLSDGQTTVDVSAVDCTGAVASGGTLLARTDLGTLSGAALTTSGAGLELILDINGEGSFTWATGSQLYAGAGTIYAGRADGAADGAVYATVTDDAHPPTVRTVDPSGSRFVTISSLEVQFSEPLLASSITDDTVQLLDGDGLAVEILDYELYDSDASDALRDSVMKLTLASDIELSEGIWTLWLSTDVTDADSNSLDGAFTGAASAFSLGLGQVDNDAPDLSSCSLSVDEFRPDGDDGAGSEADSVSLTLSATDVAQWWRLEVLDSDGDLVRMDHHSAGVTGSSVGTLSWDGRGEDGLVVDNGVYILRTIPLDAAWNEGAGCSDSVKVGNFLP